MAIKAGRVGVNPSSVDELGNVTAGGLTPEERAKLEKALVSPVTTPTEKEIVGVGTANEQIMFKIGDGLSVDGETSPFTLKASGGAPVKGSLTARSGFSLTSNANFIYKFGNLVFLEFEVTKTDLSSTSAPMFDIPTGFRPPKSITMPCYAGAMGSDNDYTSGVRIDKDGYVVMNISVPTGKTCNKLSGSVVYAVE